MLLFEKTSFTSVSIKIKMNDMSDSEIWNCCKNTIIDHQVLNNRYYLQRFDDRLVKVEIVGKNRNIAEILLKRYVPNHIIYDIACLSKNKNKAVLNSNVIFLLFEKTNNKHFKNVQKSTPKCDICDKVSSCFELNVKWQKNQFIYCCKSCFVVFF